MPTRSPHGPLIGSCHRGIRASMHIMGLRRVSEGYSPLSPVSLETTIRNQFLGTKTSRLPLWPASETTPAASMVSIRRAARL